MKKFMEKHIGNILVVALAVAIVSLVVYSGNNPELMMTTFKNK